MTRLVALIAALTLALLAALHLYWALGGRRAKAAALPEVEGRPAFTPRPAMTLLVAALLVLAALLVGAAGGALPAGLPRGVARALTGLLGLVFLARAVGDFRLVGFFKRVRGTRFARLDSAVYAPLCLALGLAALWVARAAP